MKVRLNSLKYGKQVISASLGENELDIADLDLSTPVAVMLNIDRGSTEIKIDGKVESSARFDCDRCLVNFSMQIGGTFAIIATYSDSDLKLDDENIIQLSPMANEIDLTAYIHDTLLLSVPMKILCREDCQGICPICGANHNKTECQCTFAEPDARWDSLKKLTINITEDK
ncbi:MAG TPA: DUF177 domain-containing protein [Candidatus Marinimicrobia bacterium]|nr:DUF177 domain-containing protein [Candidatus Neomarinimicrobiota bacterium]HRS51037.1 DUF177 domain-containing protein [Candidatus Neomarinimicrobiota bacterium]HRU92544.1 DUF177 domain-containing protein [Candidatus Neomarinimicrobiota bacterium]